MAKHPAGPIFRNEDGNPWNRQAVNCRFRRKRNRKNEPISKEITAYLYRGTWTTDALENEVPVATVAELLGHTSTAMVMKHYSRPSEKRNYLRNAVEQATKKSETGRADRITVRGARRNHHPGIRDEPSGFVRSRPDRMADQARSST